MSFRFISEQEFPSALDSTIRPFLDEHVIHEMINSQDGTELSAYYALQDHPRGTAVFVHGFCEFFGKYHELFWEYWQNGFNVFFVELRGHGLSQRYVDNPYHVYVERFSEYEEDVMALINKLVEPKSPIRPRVLFAHSMGGCVGALLLEDYPALFDLAILSSPMLEMRFGSFNDRQVKVINDVSKAVGLKKSPTPGAKGWTGQEEFETSSDLSYARYLYQFNQRAANEAYRTWDATYAWARAGKEASERSIRNAGNVAVPVLLCQAGKDSMVRPDGQNEFVRRSFNTRLVVMPDCKHEIFNGDDESRMKYYQAMDEFLNEYVPAAEKV